MNKVIVLHDKFTNEPIIIKTSAINAVRKAFDGIEEKEYSEIMFDTLLISVKETIGTVITKIKKAESEKVNAESSSEC